MKKIFTLLVLITLGSFLSLYGQTKVISGTVTSSVAGEGVIPGVAVSVTGTTIGAITDVNGKYSIPNVPVAAKTLTVSYIGMITQVVQINDRPVIDVVLEPSVVGLSEVLVTAFGIKRESKEVGVATAQVSNQQLTQAGVSNVVNGLTAKVSGLQINTVNNGVNPDTRITLRGNRHFLASNQALIVLDGVPISADYLNSINPNDIENVTVLKGASASALYGNEASNGVIVITTKRGQGEKPVIRVSNITTFESVSYLPKLQTRFGSGSGEDTVNALPQYTFWVGRDRNTDPYTSYENQSYGPEYNGQEVILGGVIADGSYQMVKYSPVKNQTKKFFDTGVTVQNDVSYSVGTDKSSFYLSAQDVRTTGIIPHDKNSRSGIRVSGTRTTGIFHADYSVGFTQTNTDISGDEPYQQRPVYWQVLNTPTQVDVTNYKDVVNNKFADNNGYFNAYYFNPYWQINYSRYKYRYNDLLGSALISIKPVSWLNISYRPGITYTITNRTYFRDGATFNDYMKSDPWQAGHVATSSPFAGVANDYLLDNIELTGDLLIEADNKFGGFTSRVILGNSVYSNKYRYLEVDNNSIVVPLLYNVSNRLGEPGVVETQNNRNSIGLFADVTIGYKSIAFLHGSVRNDWDSRLAKENRSFIYPGVDASIILSEAIPALKISSVLTFLKIRGGYSKTGQISLDNWYATLPSFNTGPGFPYGNVTGYILNPTLSNPLLRPELTHEAELGVESSFLKDRFHLTVNLYQSNTRDQTIPATISYATGYSGAFINAGALRTKGLEVDLNLTPAISSRDFSWNLTLSYAYNTSKVLSITSDLKELVIADVSYAIVGQQFPTLKVIDVQRDPQGRIIVDPVTGYPTKDPALKIVGHGNPNHIVGITTNFKFKGLTLNAVADYRTGNVVDMEVGSALDFTGKSWHSAQNGRQNFVIPNSVTETSPGVYTPNTNVITQDASRLFWVYSDYSGPTANNQRPYIVSGAFWKLREVTLTYDIPVARVTNNIIKAAQVGLLGRNLVMLRPVTNIWTDPEFNQQTGQSNALGYTTEYQTPPTRFFGFTVKLTF